MEWNGIPEFIGMCACIGGLDRAHLHLMGIPINTSTKDLKKSINKVLFKRKYRQICEKKMLNYNIIYVDYNINYVHNWDIFYKLCK